MDLKPHFFFSGWRLHSGFLKLALYGQQAVPVQIALKYPSYHSCFPFIDGQFAVVIYRKAIAFLFEKNRGTVMHFLLHAPFDIHSAALVICLRKTREERQHQLSLW